MIMHPDAVTALVRARPWAERPWARDLVEAFPERLREVLSRWELTVVRAFTEGAELPVLEVHGPVVGPAVVKLGGYGSDHSQQVRILRAADGNGYVRVLAHAEDLDAVLLERLGPTLWTTVADPVVQAEALAALLPRTWELPTAVGQATGPTDKARSLLSLVDEALDGGGAFGGGGALDGDDAVGGLDDRHRPVLERARELALALIAEPSVREVVLHGDPHPGNALRRGAEHVLIDPDGFLGEPEYDAGVALRDHQQVIDDLDHREGSSAGRRWHAGLIAQLATRLELDAERTAAWAHLERVTTGLHLHHLGWTEEAEAWLRTAQRVVP